MGLSVGLRPWRIDPSLLLDAFDQGNGSARYRGQSLDAFGKAIQVGLEGERPTLVEVPL
jgi:hypothetical protein